MKHAYLILAHGDFAVLRTLVTLLDDKRNGIFIHFDGKTKDLPKLETTNAFLCILSERVEVHWADVSMIEAEYLLFEKAYKSGDYEYFHLLSGADLPLKSQDEIDDFFHRNNGCEFIGYYQGDISTEIDRRLQRYHLFPHSFRERTGFLHFCKRLIRYFFLVLQQALGYKRHEGIAFKKGTQWVSLTRAFVAYLLSCKEEQLRIYRHTFCADESFVQTLCWESPFMEKLYDKSDEARGCMRAINWQDGEIKYYEEKDINKLFASDFLFARKFSGSDESLLSAIKRQVQSRRI